MQIVPFSNGIDHGIATPSFRAVRQYQALPVELFMVSVVFLE